MSYQTIIVDDEKHCVEVLEILLKNDYPDMNIVQTFTNSKEALAFLQKNTVDLVFLDIQMPFLTGIEMLNKLEEHNFHVIFTTAFDQYALEAIKLSALDYLLKPIDDDQLKTAINKFRNLKSSSSLQNQLQSFLSQMQPQSNTAENLKNDKIAVAFQDKISFYRPDEISYCRSQDNYTILHLADKTKVTASKTMKHFDEQLAPMGFIRTHQSYLVNKNLIKEFSKKDGGYLIMHDGTEIPVSRNRKEEVLHLFKKI